jgi:peroxiredoxin
MTILENSSIPSVDVAFIENSDSSNINTGEFFSSGKFILVGVPGAFTPTCHLQHFPGYVESNQAFVDKGYKVVFMSVNDPFVMKAWSEAVNNSAIACIADGNCSFTEALDLVMDGSAFGLGKRCKRFAMIIEDGTVKNIFEEEAGKLDVSAADYVLSQI